MKHQFLIEIADSPAWPAPNDGAAYQQLVRLGREGRLGECVVAVNRVQERPLTAQDALKPRSKP